jgi:hypothetical protein
MRIGVRQQVSIKLGPGGINREAVQRFLSVQDLICSSAFAHQPKPCHCRGENSCNLIAPASALLRRRKRQ